MVAVTFDIYELKNSILNKLGIRTITPGDCKRISMEISKSLKKNVSETTIKRLFGFAETKHHFSRFTITTLMEYVDQVEILSLIEPELSDLKESKASRMHLHNTSIKITSCTLKGIRNRSGLPYEMTINREFAEKDFYEFFKSEYRFTCFIAQPGYGKTTLLSHLIERSFFGEYPAFAHSSVLFITINSIINEDRNFNVEDALKEQLNIPAKESFINYIDRYYCGEEDKFILVFDGFCDIFLKRERKNQLFDSIINFICELEDCKAIKVVMSMRSTTWIRFHERMRHSSYLRSVWYQGKYFDSNDISNVPPLTIKEVDQIVSKMKIINGEEINSKLKAQLKFPFHIQLYYQLKAEDPNFNYCSNLSIYELISRFIQEKIYRSNYFTEKILFLKKIIQLTDYGKAGNSVSKGKLIGELSVFKNAYMELLVDGILMEERVYEDSHPKEFVRFIHPHIFEYFLFIEILEKFNLNVDSKVFDYIKSEYDSSQTCFILLQWGIRFVVKTGNFNILNCIFQLELNNYEKNYLILFIAENLKHRINYHPNTLDLIRQHRLHDAILKELIVFDFIDSCYKEAISVLIEISDSDDHSLSYHSILAIPDLLSLNKSKIKNRLKHLSTFKDLASKRIMDPYKAVNLIYNKIIDVPIDPDEILFSVPQTKSHPIQLTDFCTREATSYLLSLAFNLFFGDQRKVVSIINGIKLILPKLLYQRTPFAIYLLNIIGLSWARTAPGKKVDQIERILLNISEHKGRYTLTEYAQSLFRLFQAEQCKNRLQYETAIQFTEECLEVYNRNNLNINCLLAYNLLINIYMKNNDVDKVNELKSRKLRFLDEKNLPKHLFNLPRNVKAL
jgi:hypothetical protein